MSRLNGTVRDSQGFQRVFKYKRDTVLQQYPPILPHRWRPNSTTMSTTTIPETQKALLLQEKDADLVVSTIPVYTPSKDEVLVKVHSAALNPGDWKLKKWALFVKTFPNVLGFDISGEVVKVGEGVEGFKIGDRV